MLQAYWHEGMHERGVFSLFFRELPGSRNSCWPVASSTRLS